MTLSAHPMESYSETPDQQSDVAWNISPDERVGAPIVRSRRRALKRFVLVLLGLSGAGWSNLNSDTVSVSWATLTAAFADFIPADLKRPLAQSNAAPSTAPLAANLPASDPIPLAKPQTAEQPADQPSQTKTVTEPPSSLSLRAPSPQRQKAAAAPFGDAYQAPNAPKAQLTILDPLQRRATAVGLHADLSHELLERLSETDYRNAGIAVQRAIAETPDGAVFIWPRQAKPGLAVFQVHFVPGATPGCRKYVVAIAKGGWATTALPLDKCGVRAAPARG